MKFSKYSIKARLFPAVITSIPLVILSGYLVNEKYIEVFKNFKYLKLISFISTPIIFCYLFMHINRFIAREIFQKLYFKDEHEMPTTKLLLYGDNCFSQEYKSSIRKTIENTFNITLPTKAEELSDLENTKRRIAEAVGLIRGKVGNGKLLLQHNIEYGFVRNLIGGSPMGLVVSLVNVKYYLKLKHSEGIYISFILVVLYLSLIIFSKFLINRYGYIYAKRLFQEFVSDK